MIANSPEHAVEMVDDAFNRGDLEAVLSYYEAAAVVVTEPSRGAWYRENLLWVRNRGG